MFDEGKQPGLWDLRAEKDDAIWVCKVLNAKRDVDSRSSSGSQIVEYIFKQEDGKNLAAGYRNTGSGFAKIIRRRRKCTVGYKSEFSPGKVAEVEYFRMFKKDLIIERVLLSTTAESHVGYDKDYEAAIQGKCISGGSNVTRYATAYSHCSQPQSQSEHAKIFRSKLDSVRKVKCRGNDGETVIDTPEGVSAYKAVTFTISDKKFRGKIFSETGLEMELNFQTKESSTWVTVYSFGVVDAAVGNRDIKPRFVSSVHPALDGGASEEVRCDFLGE